MFTVDIVRPLSVPSKVKFVRLRRTIDSVSYIATSNHRIDRQLSPEIDIIRDQGRASTSLTAMLLQSSTKSTSRPGAFSPVGALIEGGKSFFDVVASLRKMIAILADGITDMRTEIVAYVGERGE